MPEKKKNSTMPREQVIEQADALAKELAADRHRMAALQAKLTEDIEMIRSYYKGHIDQIAADIDADEKALKQLVKSRKKDLFDMSADSDKLTLPSGAAIIRSVTRRAKRIKKAVMLSALKAANKTGAIRVAESVNWDEIDSWSDDEMAAVGTAPKRSENFEFDVENVVVKKDTAQKPEASCA